jgi:hypothetical protein
MESFYLEKSMVAEQMHLHQDQNILVNFLKTSAMVTGSYHIQTAASTMDVGPLANAVGKVSILGLMGTYTSVNGKMI